MFSQITITKTTAVPAAVLAAQDLLDAVHASIKAEVEKVATALATMNFAKFAVEGPMLTGAWGRGPEHF